jgi:hypothetical protein
MSANERPAVPPFSPLSPSQRDFSETSLRRSDDISLPVSSSQPLRRPCPELPQKNKSCIFWERELRPPRDELWRAPCLYRNNGAGRAKVVLRITIQETSQAVTLKFEGRLAGPWVAELDQLWEKTGRTLNARNLSLDLCDTTYADTDGIRALHAIIAQTGATILSSTPWTQHIAEEVMRNQ